MQTCDSVILLPFCHNTLASQTDRERQQTETDREHFMRLAERCNAIAICSAKSDLFRAASIAHDAIWLHQHCSVACLSLVCYSGATERACGWNRFCREIAKKCLVFQCRLSVIAKTPMWRNRRLVNITIDYDFLRYPQVGSRLAVVAIFINCLTHRKQVQHRI